MLDSWEIFQEIGSPNYPKRLAQIIKWRGILEKFPSIKLKITQNLMNPYKMGPEQRSFALPKAYRNLLDKS